MIRIYPKRATHCAYPNSIDEFFYRVSDSGDSLEQFVMETKSWAKSGLPVSFIDTLWRVEVLPYGDNQRRVVYTMPKSPKVDIQVIE